MKPERNIPLALKTTLGVGGPASYFVRASSVQELTEALAWATRYGVSTRILGGGSNVVVSDAGFDGLVIEIALRGVSEQPEGETVLLNAHAGEPWDELVERSVSVGLQGLECLSGIPGRVGATPIQNVGAYGQEVAETIASVGLVDRKTGSRASWAPEACRFAYRDSFFKSGEPERYVVTDVSYRLRRNAPPAIRYGELERRLGPSSSGPPNLRRVRDTVLELRRGKSMVLDVADPNRRSCGSFFVNPIVRRELAEQIAQQTGEPHMPRYPQPDGRLKLSAAWLIQRAGLTKGIRRGAVGLSTRHCLALVCHEASARAADVVDFAREVRAIVEHEFGVRLTPEPVFWGFWSQEDGLPDERLA